MTFAELTIKRMNGLIETANKNSAWEMEAAAEMMKAVHLLTLVAVHGVAQQPSSPSAVERFQKRIIEMMQAGCTGFHFATGAQWHSLDIEQKCAAMLEVWDAKSVPLDFKDSHRSPPSNQGASK